MASLKRFKSMSIDDFRRKFGSERACREYLFGGASAGGFCLSSMWL